MPQNVVIIASGSSATFGSGPIGAAPAPGPSITLSGPTTATAGSAATYTVTAANLTGPLVVTPVNVTGSAVFSPTTVNPAPGELSKLFSATWAAAGAVSIKATAPGVADSNTLTVTVSGVPTPPPPPPPPPPPAPSPSVSGTASGTASARLSSTSGATNEPVTFGMALREGAYPNTSGIAVSGLSAAQVEIRNTWPDNSAKYVVVSGRCTIPAGGSIFATLARGTSATGTALTEANLLAAGVDATLQFAGGPVMTLSSLIGVAAVSDATGLTTNGRVRQLSSGPQMSSWLYAARLSSTNAHVVGYMEVRFYGGGRVHILPWVENGFTRISGCAGQAGTLIFTMGGTTRYNVADVHLANHCRVYAQSAGLGHWNGTAPDVYAAPDPVYLQSTGLVPPFFQRDTSAATARLNGLAQNYSPTLYGQLVTSPRNVDGNGTDNGDFDPGMSAAGYHAGIGPLPEWDVFYLTANADKRAWNAVIANAMGYGRYGVHWRDEITLAPVDPTAAYIVNKTLSQTSLPLFGATTSRNSYGISDVGANQFGGSETLPAADGYVMGDGRHLLPEAWAQTHHPSGGFLAYLLTGHECFLELCQFVAATCFLRQNNLHREYGSGIQFTWRETVRGQAWGVRSIFQAATISRDGSALQTGLGTLAANNIDRYHADYIASPCAALGIPRPYSNAFNPGNAPYSVNAWELDFSVSAWGYGLAMKPPVGSTVLGKLDAYFRWHAQWVVGRAGPLGDANAYGFNCAARENSFAITNTATDAPWVGNVGPFITNWGEHFALTNNGLVRFQSSTVSAASRVLLVNGVGAQRNVLVDVAGITGASTVTVETSATGAAPWTASGTAYSTNVTGAVFNDGLTGVRYVRFVITANDGATISVVGTSISSTNSANTTNTIGAFDGNNGNFPEAYGYWGNYMMGMAWAVHHNVTGARAGYLRVVNASNWSQFDTNAATWPVGSLQASNSPPAWSGSLSTDAWTTLAAGSDYMDWANAGGIPAGAYIGTAPFASIVEAYCDPAYDGASRQYFYGGGHGDGSCNAVLVFDWWTLQWRLAGQPTPPAKYPPKYGSDRFAWGGSATQPGPLVYPSGLDAQPEGFFLDAPPLADPLDLPFATPQARVSSHMYHAAAMRGSRVHYFYGQYGEFDTADGKWYGRGVSFGSMLVAIRPQYNNVPLQQGTVAIYDEITDRFFVSLIPGDNGGGWRSGIIVFNPNTRTIQSVIETNDASYRLTLDPNTAVKVGRKIYWFTTTAAAQTTLDGGFILDMDAAAAATGLTAMSGTHAQRFSVSGFSEANAANLTAAQQTVPCFYDGTSIHRWNPRTATATYLYTLNLTPISGAGTPASPWVLEQTRRTLSNVPPGNPRWLFQRLFWHQGAQCAAMIGDPFQPAVALKLS